MDYPLDFFLAEQPAEFEAEIVFYGFFRKHLICALFYVFLYLISFSIIRILRVRSDSDELYAGDEDFFVYRVSIWMCSSALAVSIGAVTLLPFSVLGSEVLHLYPDNYYLKWLNWSLINSLWNYVFLLSNLSLFVLLPFAYFFIESQGFGSLLRQQQQQQQQQSLLARVYETLVVCSLMIAILAGIVDVFYTLVLARPHSSISFISLLSLSSLSTPLLYSFVSLTGVFLLLLSAPLGFARMFDIFTEPLFKEEGEGEKEGDDSLDSTKGAQGQEEKVEERKERPRYAHLTTPERLQALTAQRKEALATILAGSEDETTLRVSRRKLLYTNGAATSTGNGVDASFHHHNHNHHYRLHHPHHYQTDEDENEEEEEEASGQDRWYWRGKRLYRIVILWQRGCRRVRRCMRRSLLPLFNYVKYPVLMLVVLALTAISVAMVVVNTLQLLFGFRALPDVVQYMAAEVHAHHTFGIFGALLENTIILYIMFTSLVGVYSMPLLWRMRPRRRRTSMTGIIANCTTVLLLSSALPVMARTLGITSFDLLGAYGRLKWISNFSLVLSYNVAFAAAMTFCLVNKFTKPVRRELMRRFTALLHRAKGKRHFDRTGGDDGARDYKIGSNSASPTTQAPKKEKNDARVVSPSVKEEKQE